MKYPVTSNDLAERASPGELPDDEGGRKADHGAEGAQPSNTAPQKYTGTLPEVVRILRVAIDSLYVSFKGSLALSIQERLDVLKLLAQSSEVRQQAVAQIEIGGRLFAVAAHGRGRFRFLLTNLSTPVEF